MRPGKFIFREDTIANLISKALPLKLSLPPRKLLLLTIFVLPSLLAAQNSTSQKPALSSAAALYRQLSSLGLDPKQVYYVRDASIDREDIHLSLNEGAIAFTESVNGRTTGALFAGEGEILLVPPNQVERHSLAMFTKSAVLNEKFTLAYFRFSDEKFLPDLRPALRRNAAPADFVEQHDSLAKALAEPDALRTLIALTRSPRPESETNAPTGDFIRARLSGAHLGSFDLVWDTTLNEQISVGQIGYSERGRFYDQWMLFPMRSARKQEEERRQKHLSADDLYIDSVLITDYKLRTEVRPPTDLSVEAELNLDVRTSGDRTVLFELSRFLKISSVVIETAAGPVPLEFIQNEALEGSQLARRGNDLLAVVFPHPLEAGQKLKIKFAYAGSVMSEAGGGLLYVGARGTWFPNRGPWMSNFDLTFEYPLEWKLLATGKRVAQETKGANEVSRWISERPIPLAGFNLGKYVSASAKSADGNTVVQSYATRAMEKNFPEQSNANVVAVTPRRNPERLPTLELAMLGPLDPARNASMVAERSARTIDFLSQRLGPFPYSSLALTQMPGPDSQGWPGLVFLSSHVFLTPAERATGRGTHYPDSAEEMIYARLMAAHETAHQWWGDAIFWQSFRDQWIMEGLANYSAILQLEVEDPQEAKSLLTYYRKGLEVAVGGDLPKREAGPVSLGLRLNSSRFPGAYESVAYGRGTWLLHMLRHMLRDASLQQAGVIGLPLRQNTRAKASRQAQIQPERTSLESDPDALFYAALRGLQKKFAGRVMSTQDLQLAMEEVLPKSLYFEGKRSLDWFFEGWVNGTAMPKLEVDKFRLITVAGKTMARATLLQKDAPESLVTSVPIYAMSKDGRLTYIERVFADGAETPIKVAVPAATKKLIVDPFGTVLTGS